MKNLVLIIGLVVFTSTLFSSKAIAKEMVINSLEEWALVKSENGINVYFSEAGGDEGALKLKFENTNSTETNLKCEISAKNAKDFHQEFNIFIKANSSVEFIDATAPILINSSQTEKGFTINFK